MTIPPKDNQCAINEVYLLTLRAENEPEYLQVLEVHANIKATRKYKAPLGFYTHFLRFVDAVLSKDCKIDLMLASKVLVEEAYQAVWKEVLMIQRKKPSLFLARGLY